MFFHRANAARAQEMVWRVTSPKRAEIRAAFIVEHASKVHFDVWRECVLLLLLE